ncbi:MAG TPA: DNA polymerase III subunit delta' [Casimicrobiaceae bacterium]|nr:DNA polymerase III subunit delta' [Casimicrobiaceae bacterium]
MGATVGEGLLPWHRALAQAMLERRARWPQALLIAGRQGLGKRALAAHFARALLCETPTANGEHCGGCAGCRYMAARAHPDFRLIEPTEVDDDGNVEVVDWITVERIRDLTAFTQLSTHRHRAKIAVIAPAEAMNPPAANALLKTLEEPQADTYLILVSHQPARLPATIVSRCQRLDIPKPDAAAAVAWLATHQIADAARVLAQAGGSPLLALELATPALLRESERWIGELAKPERLSPIAVGARFDATPKDERKALLAAAFQLLLSWTADLAAVASGGAPRFHPEHAATLASLAQRVARVPLFRYYRTLLEQRGLLAHPLQPRLVAEALLIEYRKLFGAGQGLNAAAR